MLLEVMTVADPYRKSSRERLYEIIFEADTRAGKAFDLAVILAIVLSVLAVMLESVAAIRAEYGELLRTLEWIFTILFTVEYMLRLLTVKRASAYALSFYGIIDLLAISPSYVSLVLPGAQGLLVLRALRLLRIFRIMKLVRYVGEAQTLAHALRNARPKITVFLLTVLTLVLIVGTLMYLIEGERSGFTSIPRSIYWAIVTMTTVGYGDITPATVVGQVLAACIMIIGYGIIAVPTGIVSVELARATRALSTQTCPACLSQDHDIDAVYCKHCGAKLNPAPQPRRVEQARK